MNVKYQSLSGFTADLAEYRQPKRVGEMYLESALDDSIPPRVLCLARLGFIVLEVHEVQADDDSQADGICWAKVSSFGRDLLDNGYAGEEAIRRSPRSKSV